MRSAMWIVPWLIGHGILGYLGNYGHGPARIIPDGWDVALVSAYALGMFYWIVSLAQKPEQVEETIARDAHQLADITHPDIAF